MSCSTFNIIAKEVRNNIEINNRGDILIKENGIQIQGN